MKTRIAIVGIGGVGGYLGGMLAAQYANDPEVEIIFVARGAHAEAIRKGGIRLITPEAEYLGVPDLVTDKAETCGKVDYILYCTKSYDVERGISDIRPMIAPHTVVLPFLNGVDGEEIICEMLPDTAIWRGCVFIVSQIAAPGVIRQEGTIARYFLGAEGGDVARMQFLSELCVNAGIDAIYTPDIERRIWDKFSFISPVATLTTYLNRSVGEIMSSDESRNLLITLNEEFLSVAKALRVSMSERILEKNLQKTEAMPATATSSMQRDHAARRPCELEALTGYIVLKGIEYGIATPTYALMYETIKARP